MSREGLMALDKYHLNLAGEYRVAAELLKRGIFATITYGNKKGADTYAIGPNRRTAVVEVKTSNSLRFVTGFYQKYKVETQDHPDFWVLYRLALHGDEDFYVLTHEEMAIAQSARNYPNEHLRWEQHAERVARGVDNVLGHDLQEHLSAWHKIVRWCTT
jgi:hypothetical protein